MKKKYISETQGCQPIASLLLGLFLLLSGHPLIAQEEREEIFERRDVYTKVFDNFDGSETFQAGLEPLHYRPSGQEVYLEIDPTLVEEEGWRNETNSFPSFLPPMLGDGAAIELGPELGIRWLPGALFARTTFGEDIELALAAPSWGVLSETLDNAVVYPDLYPGLDVIAEIRPGALNIKVLFREWLFEVAPEQVQFLFTEAQLEPDASLLEAVEARANAGEEFAAIPLYFGRAEEEYVIGMFGHPGIPEAHLEDHRDALTKDEEGGWLPLPDGWRSKTAEFLSTGKIRHFFHHPANTHLEAYSGVGTSSAALLASFEFSGHSGVHTTRFANVKYTSALAGVHAKRGFFGGAMKCQQPPPGPPTSHSSCTMIWNTIIVGKSQEHYYRTWLAFTGFQALLKELTDDKTREVFDIQLGFFGASSQKAYTGFAGFSTDEIISYSAVPYLFKPGLEGRLAFKKLPTVFSNPHNEDFRSVPGGMIKTSTWSPHSQHSSTKGNFQFGKLNNKRSGTAKTRAVEDFNTLVLGGNEFAPSFLLAMPFDRSPCTLCTANHPDPAVQALNGDYRVGAMFNEMRLEVTTRTIGSTRFATLSASSVGGHQDDLYPGETRAWDIEMTSFVGQPGTLELYDVPWSSANGVEVWFSDPATGTTLYNPPLSQVGDKVRVHAKWTRADPTLYGQTKSLEVGGFFQSNSILKVGRVEIPIRLKAPEAQPTFPNPQPIFNGNDAGPAGLAELSLPSQGLRAGVWATALVEGAKGPTQKLQQGKHWTVRFAHPGSPGDVFINPNQFQPGIHEVDLTPCLRPAGNAAPFHCLKANKQRLTFEILPSPTGHPPAIDFISPSSIDSPSGGPVIVSVQGLNLGGTDPATKVRVPQLLAQTTPRPGSTDSRVSVRIQTASTQVCGPRNLSVITSAGTDTAIFNVTKPFTSGIRHFAVEAEAGVVTNLNVKNLFGASGSKAVGTAATGDVGKLTIFFQVPATANYQVHTLYSTSNQGPARGKITILEDDPITGNRTTVKSFDHRLGAVPAGQAGLRPLTEVGQIGGVSSFNLTAGKYYRLELETISGQNFPIYDLLVFSDGRVGPKLAEICR
ncbi:MAG: hypothetical protein K0U98_08620 [Deltaproteobacteria bacterium]|nr:hypothetical protein [Deltaproteobacteria bacterium]